MRLIPRVLVVDEIPQWITSSDRAAYHPASSTIYVRRDLGLLTLAHEVAHHVLCLARAPESAHAWLDRRRDQ